MWLWVKLFGRNIDWHVALGAVLAALVTAAACAEVLTALVRRSISARAGTDERRRRARTTTRVVRVLLLILLTVVSTSILAPLEVLGVEALGDSAVTIRARIKTVPQRQWDVARELRPRIKQAFDAAGIEIPMAPLSPPYTPTSTPSRS